MAVLYSLLLLVFFLGGAHFRSLEADGNKKQNDSQHRLLDALPRDTAAAGNQAVDQLEFIAA